MVDMMHLLQKLSENFDITKETHEGKQYWKHVEECYELAGKLVGLYYQNDELEKFTFALCALHDLGKLLPNWDLHKDERPLHALEGAEWFLVNKEKLDFKAPYEDMLAYFLLSHHSPLLVPGAVKKSLSDYEETCGIRFFKTHSKIRRICKQIGTWASERRELSVKLVDAMGMFKLADIASSMNIPSEEILSQYMELEKLEPMIRKKIEQRAKEKTKQFDGQKFRMQENIASINGRHLLLAAPTGWGKTALSLLRIAHLKPFKTFYVLPTITAIKEFYEDLEGVFGPNYVGEYFYFLDVELLQKRGDSVGYDREHLFDIYRYFIPKVTVTTIDQILLTMLQSGKYYIKRFNFNNALFIFDEYHLFTPEMIAVLEMFFSEFSKLYKFSSLLMSATPSPLYEDELQKVLPDLKVCTLKPEYEKLKRHKIEHIDDTIDEFIKDKTNLLHGKRTLIISNTVYGAQKVYRELRSCLKGKKIVLLHRKFTYKDRSEKEKEIDKADILVSTQVAEVSLDVSFDRLITELAPIPSLVQRFGRVNRYGGSPSEVNVFICREKTQYPYLLVALDCARDKIDNLIDELQKKNEVVYLDRDFWDFELIFEDEIDEAKKELEKRGVMQDFYSYLAKEEKMLCKFLGREESWLAVPDLYLNDIYALFNKLREIRSYEDRRSIYAQIKKYFIPISRGDLKKAQWDEHLRCYIVHNYDDRLGLLSNENLDKAS